MLFSKNCLLVQISIVFFAKISPSFAPSFIAGNDINVLTSSSTEAPVKANNVKPAPLKLVDRIVDSMVSEFTERIAVESNGVIKVPDVTEKYAIVGEFSAVNGTFSNLTTLSRIGAAKMIKIDRSTRTLLLSSNFGISKAHVVFDKFKLNLAFIKVSGKLLIDVDGVQILANVSGDYSVEPCQLTLEDLEIIDLGALNIKVTGLGPFDFPASEIISWIVKTWRDKVIDKVHGMVTDLIQEVMSKFDCKNNNPFVLGPKIL